MGKVEKPRLQPDSAGAGTSAKASAMASDSVIPFLDFLRASDTIQARVDDRIKELQAMHEVVLMIITDAKGKYLGPQTIF